MSYTANDFCGLEIFDSTHEALVAKYAKGIWQQLRAVQDKYRPHPMGTKVILMAPFSVPQLLTNQALLEKQVKFFDDSSHAKCVDLRGSNIQKMGDKYRIQLAQAIQGMCGSILKSEPGDLNKSQFFNTVFNGVVNSQAQIVRDLNQRSKPGWEFKHFRKNYDMPLQATDIANDCFHPSLSLHIKVARELLNDLK